MRSWSKDGGLLDEGCAATRPASSTDTASHGTIRRADDPGSDRLNNLTPFNTYGAAQEKFSASSMLPVPLYFATCG